MKWPRSASDDEDNKRGYELTITGTGFNNGTGADGVRPASGQSHGPDGNLHAALIANDDSESSLGTAETVGSDDKVVGHLR